jgi:hypothetical protein
MKSLADIRGALPFEQLSMTLRAYDTAIILSKGDAVTIKFSDLEDWDLAGFCSKIDMTEEAFQRILPDIIKIIEVWADDNKLTVRAPHIQTMDQKLSNIRFIFALAKSETK